MADPIQYLPVFSAQPDFSNLVSPGTRIIDTPALLNTALTDEHTYWVTNFTTNLNSFVTPIETYVNASIAEANAAVTLDITTALEIQPPQVKTYDMRTTESILADLAENANLLAGNTVQDILDGVVSGVLPTASVANATTVENKSVQDILDSVPPILVLNAVNANKFNNYTYDDVKQDIIGDVIGSISSDANTFGGFTTKTYKDFLKLDAATNWSVLNSTKFGGLTLSDMDTRIASIPATNAENANTVGNNSINDITNAYTSAITTATGQYLTDYSIDVTAFVKAVQVDESINTLKFNNLTLADIDNRIENTTVRNAVNSTTFNNLSAIDWETFIHTAVTNDTSMLSVIQSKVQTEWKAFDSIHADTADFATNISNTLVEEIKTSVIASVSGGSGGSIDASTLNGDSNADIVYASGNYIKYNGVSQKTKSFIDINSSLETSYNSNEFINRLVHPAIQSSTGLNIDKHLFFNSFKYDIPGEFRPQGPTALFDPEALNWWSRKDRTYDTNGFLTNTDYYITLDLNWNPTQIDGVDQRAFYEVQGTNPGAEIISLDKRIYSYCSLTGTSSKNEELIVSYNTGVKEETVADINGNWTITSTTEVKQDVLGLLGFSVVPKYNVRFVKTHVFTYQDSLIGLQVGDVANITYTITNNNLYALTGVVLSDANVGIIIDQPLIATLPQQTSISVSATYVVQAADVTAGDIPVTEATLVGTYSFDSVQFTKYNTVQTYKPSILTDTYNVFERTIVNGSTETGTENFTVTMPNAEVITGTSDAYTRFSVESASLQVDATHTPNIVERKMLSEIITIDTTPGIETLGIISSKEIFLFINSLLPNATAADLLVNNKIFGTVYTTTFDTQEVLGLTNTVDVVLTPQEYLTQSGPSGIYPKQSIVELNNTKYKNDTTISQTNAVLNPTLNINLFVDYVINGTTVGSTITYTYSVQNLSGASITGLTVSDTNVNIVITGGGVITSVLNGATQTITGTYTITAQDVELNSLPVNTGSVTGTDGNSATFTRGERKEVQVRITDKFYPLITTQSIEIGTNY